MAMNYKMNPDMIYCHGCSEAGGADKGVYHLPPECKSTNPEPTLTCSEVVERLRKCVATFRHPSGEQALTYATFDTEKATEILDSWRERRVQELEELLREMVKQNGVHSGECFSCDLFVRERGKHSADCPIPKAEALLAKSEQIRKGAK